MTLLLASLQQYWVSSQPYRHIAVKDIAEAFKAWKVGKANAQHLATPFPKEKSHPAALVTTPYALSMMPELKALMRREVTLVQREYVIFQSRQILTTISLHACLRPNPAVLR